MSRKTITTIFFLTLLLLSNLPFQVLAHNGARDELGGHFRSADCVYLLHNPTKLAKTATNVSELIPLIKEHNSSSCTNELTESKVDLEGYAFASSGSVNTVLESSNPPLELGKTYKATLEKCIDGDTATFTINGHSYKTRFLYIDTPESTNQQEAFGKEASEFTCAFLKQGIITIETDGPSLYDKYDRLLAWVFVDGVLHQEAITKAGLVEDFYDYGTYKYESQLQAAMQEARGNSVGMYKTVGEEKVQETLAKGDSVLAETKSKESSTKSELAETDVETTKTDETSGSESLGIFALVTVFLFFMFPRFCKKRGIKPLLAHKLWTKNLWVNALLLFPLYTAMFFFVLVILIVETVRFIRLKK